VAGHVGNLDQVGAALHRGGHEARPQAVAGEGRSLEPELGGGSFDDGRDVARNEAPIRDALRQLVEDTPKTAPSVISEASSHARSAAIGHVISPRGIATLRPMPSWSVFERRIQEAFGHLLEVLNVAPPARSLSAFLECLLHLADLISGSRPPASPRALSSVASWEEHEKLERPEQRWKRHSGHTTKTGWSCRHGLPRPECARCEASRRGC